MGFEPHQAVTVVFPGEFAGEADPVLMGASRQVVGDAGVERAVAAIGEDIEVVAVVAHCGSGRQGWLRRG